MYRFTTLIGLIVVGGAVSAMSASFSTTSLVVATACIAAGVLIRELLWNAESAEAGGKVPAYHAFLAQVFANILRFAMPAALITWAVVGARWLLG